MSKASCRHVVCAVGLSTMERGVTIPRRRGDGIEQPRISSPVSDKYYGVGILDDTSRFENDHPPNAEKRGQAMGNYDDGAPWQNVMEIGQQSLL